MAQLLSHTASTFQLGIRLFPQINGLFLRPLFKQKMLSYISCAIKNISCCKSVLLSHKASTFLPTFRLFTQGCKTTLILDILLWPFLSNFCTRLYFLFVLIRFDSPASHHHGKCVMEGDVVFLLWTKNPLDFFSFGLNMILLPVTVGKVQWRCLARTGCFRTKDFCGLASTRLASRTTNHQTRIGEIHFTEPKKSSSSSSACWQTKDFCMMASSRFQIPH